MNNAIQETFAALADPTRLAIVERLARKPRRVTDIAAPFDMSLNAVSKHLKVLERAGVVRRVRHGREHHFSLEGRTFARMSRWVGRYERFWNRKLDALESMLREGGDLDA